MIININQQKISFGDQYKIYLNKKPWYRASKQYLSFPTKISLYELETSAPKLILKRRWKWFKTQYDLFRNDSEPYKFRTINSWKSHYICHADGDVYEIFGHHGRKYSVYQNNVQIAYWNKNAVVWFDGDNYKIVANNDCDYELVMAFCLIIDNKYEDSNNGSMLTIDLGNFGSEVKPFNTQWKPK